LQSFGLSGTDNASADVMNNFGGGVGQGRDMVLYNAFDWEHLRQRFVKLPGAARSAASGRQSSKESQKEMMATLNARRHRVLRTRRRASAADGHQSECPHDA